MRISDLLTRADESIPKSLIVGRTYRGMLLKPATQDAPPPPRCGIKTRAWPRKYPEVVQDFEALSRALRDMNEESKPEYFRRLEELGIKRLGHGGFARVFQHPTHPEVAVKVFTSSDKAYAAYLRFVQKRQHNKYLPKVLSVHEHVHTPEKGDTRGEIDRLVDDEYTIVFMEKLQPATKKDVQVFLDHVQDLIGMKYTSMQAIGERWNDLASQSQDPDLAQAAKAMVVMNNKYFVDLRGEKNVMMRGKQLVFTDPVS